MRYYSTVLPRLPMSTKRQLEAKLAWSPAEGVAAPIPQSRKRSKCNLAFLEVYREQGVKVEVNNDGDWSTGSTLELIEVKMEDDSERVISLGWTGPYDDGNPLPIKGDFCVSLMDKKLGKDVDSDCSLPRFRTGETDEPAEDSISVGDLSDLESDWDPICDTLGDVPGIVQDKICSSDSPVAACILGDRAESGAFHLISNGFEEQFGYSKKEPSQSVACGVQGTMAHMDQYLKCREELLKFIDETNCAPIMVRLAWHDSGNFDKRICAWPDCGGANGSIIHEPEISFGANAGLTKAVGYLKSFKQKFPAVSWADLIQMASACAVQATGGPALPMRYGRVDVQDGSACPPPTSRGTAGNAGLPDAMAPFGCGAQDAPTHLRNIFYRMGFDDEGIVALSGPAGLTAAPCCHGQERSGTVENGYGDAKASTYTGSGCPVRHDGKVGVGMPGGKAWTKNWLTFDNSYFQSLAQPKDDSLIRFPTDVALYEDPQFKAHFQRFAGSQEAFFEAYARAHVKLSELGSRFQGGGPSTNAELCGKLILRFLSPDLFTSYILDCQLNETVALGGPKTVEVPLRCKTGELKSCCLTMQKVTVQHDDTDVQIVLLMSRDAGGAELFDPASL
ncbi:unnamed protein product [Effrenium voratum]|nr:unnamed protein product [Effrenium voratum]